MNDTTSTESIHGKLTAIIRYSMRYKQGEDSCLLSFGIGEDIVVNSIIGILTIRQWGDVLDFGDKIFKARCISTKFNLLYEHTVQDLTNEVVFDTS